MGNYSDAKSSIRCFSKASVSLFGIIGIGFSKTSSRKLHRNLHHRKYNKAVLACFRSVQIKACEKIPQGEPSLAKFLKNLLFWTFWPAKSSKTTLFEKIPQGESSLAKFLKNLLFWTFWPAKSSKTTLFEKIHQGESSLAKFLKNILFWTFWPAKSSKMTLFEKIHQDLDGSSPNVLVCTEALPGGEQARTAACNP